MHTEVTKIIKNQIRLKEEKEDVIMGVVFVFLVFLAIFTAILCFMKNYRKIMLDIPAPKALPLIGHAHLMIGLNNEGTHEHRKTNSDYNGHTRSN